MISKILQSLCLKPKSVISGNLSKNAHFWGTQWPTSRKLKIKFDLSLGLDRSRYEFYKIIKDHGPKNPSPGNLCNSVSDPRTAQ